MPVISDEVVTRYTNEGVRQWAKRLRRDIRHAGDLDRRFINEIQSKVANSTDDIIDDSKLTSGYPALTGVHIYGLQDIARSLRLWSTGTPPAAIPNFMALLDAACGEVLSD